MTQKPVKFAVAFLLPLACVAAMAVPLEESRSGVYAQDGLGLISQAAAMEIAEGSNYEVAAYPAFPLHLAEGAGRGETQIYCSSCHTPRYILMQPPLPAATWDAEVKKMIKTYGAQIPEADAQKISQYLQAHYTPETRK